jgi:SAM-dependent methyltransferase
MRSSHRRGAAAKHNGAAPRRPAGAAAAGRRHHGEARERSGSSELYRAPRLYDVAFGFRDIEAECRGLLRLAARHGVPRVGSVLELACGPAHHLRTLAARGIRCHGIDLSADMLAYARRFCRREGVAVTFQRADMRRFTTARRFDLAVCLFDSYAQCVTDEDAVAALRCAGRALRPGGLMVVEFTHPAEYFRRGSARTSERWTQREGRLAVRATFRLTRPDPIHETVLASLTLRPVTAGRNGATVRPLKMRWRQRMWLRGSFANVVAASECFEIVGWYGDLDRLVPLDMRTQAWRMLAVLRRIPRGARKTR